MFFRGRKIEAFGLDVSDSSIKVLQLAAHGRGFMPKAYVDEPLSDRVISNHMIINQSRLAENISRAVQHAKIDLKHVVCSIPEAKSFVRTLEIPVMSETEIDGAIPYELEQDIPIPIDQVYFDWQVIRQTPASPAGGPEKLKLLVTAAPKEYVDALVETLSLAKLTPIAMELESQAIVRALIGPDDSTRNILIVDISSKLTSFIIVVSGNIDYTSSIPIAGDALSENIARTLNINLPAAEKLKKTAGLVKDINQANIRQAILPILDNIIEEIKNVIRFFEERNGEGSINRILLCGGGAKLSGVVDYVNDRINLGSNKSAFPVHLGHPWFNSSMNQLEALGFTTVGGLALRGIGYEAD